MEDEQNKEIDDLVLRLLRHCLNRLQNLRGAKGEKEVGKLGHDPLTFIQPSATGFLNRMEELMASNTMNRSETSADSLSEEDGQRMKGIFFCSTDLTDGLWEEERGVEQAAG